ncbi:MAG: FGGY family carbohydrate kinase, partial [Clostridia bacterium]|nr:FGGY family carbohydrate kinase [Clostridia bacterium]
MYVIGLDIGTTTLSAVVLNARTGSVEGTFGEANDCGVPSEDTWSKTQDPEAILAACKRLLRSAGSASVSAVGLTGQMHGLVYVDDSGHAASPLFTWQDGRGDQPVAEVAGKASAAHERAGRERRNNGGETVAERLSRLTGYTLATGFGSVTHYWHALRGAVPKRAVSICTVADYVGMRLCNCPQPLMHASNAASFGLFAPKLCAFDAGAVGRASVDPAVYPRVTSGMDIIGADAGGVPVSVAIGDNQASFLGAVRAPGDSVLINV